MRKINLSIIPFLILIFGFFLRFGIINFGLPSKNLALTTYNPDEPLSYYTIEKWNPKKLYFHPHRAFLWGGFHLYPLAASLAIGKVFGYIKFGDRNFYIANLSEADRLYIVGRILMILFAVGSILLIFFVLRNAYSNPTAVLSSLLLAITPAHVFNSIYVRPDIMMMFFGLTTMYFSVKLLTTGKTKYYFLSCISVGLATGSKLSGAAFGICPLLAHLLSPSLFSNDKENILRTKFLNYKLWLIPLVCLVGFVISSPYVIIDFNRTQESFLSYLRLNIKLAGGAMDFGQKVILGYGPLSYFRSYLRYGLGDMMVFMTIIGGILMIIQCFRENNKFDFIFLISGVVVLYVISMTKNQAVWYTFPFIPFCIIYCVRGLEILFLSRQKIMSSLAIIAFIFLVTFTVAYMFSHWRLYKEKNVREEVSEWILKNIPAGSKIAIARSYFWTPPVLRQYNPPYKVLMGGDPVSSSVQEGVLGLEKLLDEAEYVVLTEYEYRWAVHPKPVSYTHL
ncbi:MAG: glycosyltransferase family 39 protein, partial [Endomicrobia bacterium]|nr:glycosyltransferase family 39 protein [Endomicrobiia bacterium]